MLHIEYIPNRLIFIILKTQRLIFILSFFRKILILKKNIFNMILLMKFIFENSDRSPNRIKNFHKK